jgi:hypothetical protein
MKRQKHNYDQLSHPYVPPEGNKATLHVLTTFSSISFYAILTKIKMLLGLNDNNKKNYYKTTTKPLKSRLKHFDCKGN